MIEIVETDEDFQLFINGTLLSSEEGVVYEHTSNLSGEVREWWSVRLKDTPFCLALTAHRWSDIPSKVEGIGLQQYFDWLPLPHTVGFNVPRIAQYKFDNGEYPEFSYFIYPPEDGIWVGSRFIEYCDEFARRLSDTNYGVCMIEYSSDDGLNPKSLRFRVCMDLERGAMMPLVEQKIQDHIAPISQAFEEIHQAAVATLMSSEAKNAVAMHFDFPESVKEPCEQYLLYFARFLKDAGMNATTDLKHEAGGVLFTVTPESGEEALSKIRQALDVYLQLPANPSIIHTPVFQQPFEMQMMAANVQHLHSQLTFAQAREQMLLATTQAQAVTIQSLTSGQFAAPQPVNVNVLVESLRPEPAEPKEKDKEVLLYGAAELVAYEGKGFNINLPIIYRWVKNLMFENKSKPSASTDLSKFEN